MGRPPNPNKQEKKPKNKKEFVESEELVQLAQKVIADNKLDYLDQVRIKYVLVDQFISSTTVAQCVKASKELKYFGKLDYVIKVSLDVWSQIDNKAREIILLHELLHILLTTNKEGDLNTKILDHDIKDFSIIIKKFGIDWFWNFKTIVSSVRDLDPSKTDNIKV
jgi:predicted metallopeptidase